MEGRKTSEVKRKIKDKSSMYKVTSIIDIIIVITIFVNKTVTRTTVKIMT